MIHDAREALWGEVRSVWVPERDPTMTHPKAGGKFPSTSRNVFRGIPSDTLVLSLAKAQIKRCRLEGFEDSRATTGERWRTWERKGRKRGAMLLGTAKPEKQREGAPRTVGLWTNGAQCLERVVELGSEQLLDWAMRGRCLLFKEARTIWRHIPSSTVWVSGSNHILTKYTL